MNAFFIEYWMGVKSLVLHHPYQIIKCCMLSSLYPGLNISRTSRFMKHVIRESIFIMWWVSKTRFQVVWTCYWFSSHTGCGFCWVILTSLFSTCRMGRDRQKHAWHGAIHLWQIAMDRLHVLIHRHNNTWHILWWTRLVEVGDLSHQLQYMKHVVSFWPDFL